MAEGIGYGMKVDLKPAVSGDKPKVEVRELPKTEAPKAKGETVKQMSPMDHSAARKKAIQKALEKKKAKSTQAPAGE